MEYLRTNLSSHNLSSLSDCVFLCGQVVAFRKIPKIPKLERQIGKYGFKIYRASQRTQLTTSRTKELSLSRNLWHMQSISYKIDC